MPFWRGKILTFNFQGEFFFNTQKYSSFVAISSQMKVKKSFFFLCFFFFFFFLFLFIYLFIYWFNYFNDRPFKMKSKLFWVKTWNHFIPLKHFQVANQQWFDQHRTSKIHPSGSNSWLPWWWLWYLFWPYQQILHTSNELMMLLFYLEM